MSAPEDQRPDPVWRASPEQADRLHLFSHDLKNRLTGLYEVTRHLAENPDSEETAEFTRFAEKQFFAALRAVEVLMDDMQVPRGSSSARPEDSDLATLLQKAVEGQRYRYDAKQQQLLLEAPEHLPARVDPQLLEQLFSALIGNASKFSHRDATIEVRLWNDAGDALLTVKDPGVGLSAADIPLVFERYVMRSSRSTAGEAQGRSTLARARQWAEAHGANLEVASPGPGQGCTFTLRLPLGNR